MTSNGPSQPQSEISPDTPALPDTPTTPAHLTGAARVTRTRISGIWIAVIVAALLLIFLLIFILQNLASATVHYLGASGTLPLGVALLLASVGGALLVALVGTARILQLRRLATTRDTASPSLMPDQQAGAS